MSWSARSSKRGPSEVNVLLRCAATLAASGCVAASTAGQSCPPTDINAPDSLARHFGWSLANVGDVDGDGWVDLAVGDPTGGPGYDGRVHVFSGRDLSIIHVLPTGSTTPQRRFGESIAPAGDFDEDGFADLLIGVEGDERSRGRVHFYSGRTGRLIAEVVGDVRGGRFGSSVDRLGDVNGDGRDDFVVGARIGLSAHVISGMDFSTLYIVSEQESGEEFGGAVSAAGDLNGDDRTDFLVGAPANAQAGLAAGCVYAFSGVDGVLLGRVLGSGDGSRFGSSVALLGDVDGDEIGDFAVGAPGFQHEAGRIAIVSGAALGVLLEVDGEAGSRFGSHVAAAGDIDGDQHPDLLVGAPRARDRTGRIAGRAYLVGSDGSILRVEEARGGRSQFGRSAAGGFRFDDDGTPDFAVGAPSNGFDPAAYTYSSDCSLRLEVSASCPRGGTIQVSWTNATPESLIILFFASQRGTFEIPPGQICEGAMLGLSLQRLRVVYRGSSGIDGRRTLQGTTGRAACGGFLQLLDTETCRLTNVAPIE